MIHNETVEVYAPLLEEGVDTWRSTQAIPMGNDIYKILPTENYDPEDEIWAFLPGSLVRCVMQKRFRDNTEFLRAVEKVE